jgi:hypothetical protein
VKIQAERRMMANENGMFGSGNSVKRILANTLIAIIVAATLIYVFDYLFWRYRLATGHNPYGTVTVQFYYAIGEKNGKTEYDFQPPQPETCANSLLPHSGYSPCWYERKHTQKAIRV